MMKEISSSMNFRFTYQPKRLIGFGIVFIILCTAVLVAFYYGIINDFSPNPVGEFILFIIIYIILEPCVIFWGFYRIRLGRKKIILEFEGTHLRKYENQKLKIEISVDELEKITYTYPDTLEWRTIVFQLLNKKKIKLTISEKKELLKFEEFFKFLVYYSKKYNILFEENEIKQRAFPIGF
ncbi:MAG: hypothetical protein EU529_07965 [Promethearchaeota archaeon]|nr:MAG: hypothetical protein EU529_07965 [Candidatus Lokiarchaeota archaeon]